MARIKAYIEPTHINWEKISVKFVWNEKIISSTIEIKDCKINNEKIVLNHVLKNQDVEWFINVKNAKGVSKIKTFNTIYRKAYENNKLNREIEIKLFNIPSKENKLKLDSSTDIIEFIFCMSEEKEMSWLNIFFPISLIEEEIKEFND